MLQVSSAKSTEVTEIIHSFILLETTRQQTNLTLFKFKYRMSQEMKTSLK